MKKTELGQLIKNTAAFTAFSIAASDAGLLLLDRLGFDIPNHLYIDAPLAIWTVTGAIVTGKLADRIIRQVDSTPGRIVGFAAETDALTRSIPFNTDGKKSTLLANSVKSIFGSNLPETITVYRPIIWRVPIDDIDVTVRESELRAFLDVAYRRTSYQFSRRYWLRRRRPPLWRGKYEAYMRLLTEAGLVEGRSSGASGYLLAFPREAISYLKYESEFRIK